MYNYVHYLLVCSPFSPAMRPRHWKQVLRYASMPSHLLGRGGTFDPALLEELTFGQLLEMNLHSKQNLCSQYLSSNSRMQN